MAVQIEGDYSSAAGRTCIIRISSSKEHYWSVHDTPGRIECWCALYECIFAILALTRSFRHLHSGNIGCQASQNISDNTEEIYEGFSYVLIFFRL